MSEARDCYLRSAEYYRLALTGTVPGTAEHRSWSDAQVSAFRAALPLLPHPGVPFAIVIDSTPVAGYLFRSAVEPSPGTVVCRPMEQVSPEAVYVCTAAPILELGLNCVIFGPLNQRNLGATKGSDSEPPGDRLLELVAGWVRGQPGIDPRSIMLPPRTVPTSPRTDRCALRSDPGR